MLSLSIIILLLILLFALKLDVNSKQYCEGFYSKINDPDKILVAGYTVHQNQLPPNKIINKGYNSNYWNCFEYQTALGSHNHEILAKCQRFT